MIKILLKNKKVILSILGWILLVVVLKFSLFFLSKNFLSSTLNLPLSETIQWIISFFGAAGFYIYFVIMLSKGKKQKKLIKDNAIASAEWMEKEELNKLSKEVDIENDEYSHGFIVKTKLHKRNSKITAKIVKPQGHTITIGSTGAGKTALLVNPQIRVLANSKEKPSMIITDPKGELWNFHAKKMMENGYDVKSLNLRDVSSSSFWNPLGKIWDLWFSYSQTDVEREDNKERAITYMNEMTKALFPREGKEDPFWDGGAHNVFKFMVILNLELKEYGVDEKINKENFNINNILGNLNAPTPEELVDMIDGIQSFLKKLSKKTGKNIFSKALAMGAKNIRGSEQTTSGIIQTCITKLDLYNDPIVKRITSKTNISIDTRKPQAIFVIVPDESNAKYPFVALFVAEIYKELIATAATTQMKLKREFYLIMDEFANIPKLADMTSYMTVARSRGIYIMIFIQNYEQLNEKYGKDTAETLTANSSIEYFMLTNNESTAKKFSQKLGNKLIKTSSKSTSHEGKSSSSESERTRPLIFAEDLMKMEFGNVIIDQQRKNPLRTKMGIFFKWKNFKEEEEFQFNNLKNIVYSDLENMKVTTPKELINKIKEIHKNYHFKESLVTAEYINDFALKYFENKLSLKMQDKIKKTIIGELGYTFNECGLNISTVKKAEIKKALKKVININTRQKYADIQTIEEELIVVIADNIKMTEITSERLVSKMKLLLAKYSNELTSNEGKREIIINFFTGLANGLTDYVYTDVHTHSIIEVLEEEEGEEGEEDSEADEERFARYEAMLSGGGKPTNSMIPQPQLPAPLDTPTIYDNNSKIPPLEFDIFSKKGGE